MNSSNRIISIDVFRGLTIGSHDPTFKVFLGYLVNRNMPEWKVPNTLAKYYITTTALEMTNEKN